jgi:hypothetical protein
MKILVCASTDENIWDKLKESVLDQLPFLKTEVVSSIEALINELSRPLHGVSVVVIFPAGKKEIQDLYQIRGLFDNLRLIAVLQNEEKSLVSAALQLQPSFISYLSDDFDDMEAVLDKISTNSLSQKQVG